MASEAARGRFPLGGGNDGKRDGDGEKRDGNDEKRGGNGGAMRRAGVRFGGDNLNIRYPDA